MFVIDEEFERFCAQFTTESGEGRLRADYKEMAPEVQGKVLELWPQVTNENLYEISDLAGYKADFLRLFGFGIDGVDYEADVNPDVAIPGIVEV